MKKTIFLLIALCVFSAGQAFGAAAHLLQPLSQFTNDAGVVGTGYKLYTYDPGTTNNKATYKDDDLTDAHPNPVILNAAGRPTDNYPIYFDGEIKYVLKTSADVVIYTVDEYYGSGAFELSGYYDKAQLLLGSWPASRAQVAWTDTDTITLGPFKYWHDGTTDQYVYSTANITFDLGPGGSNAGSSALGASEWHYIYLDDSAIVTAATNSILAAQVLNSTTAPTKSASKNGWYNGNDRCIFAVRTSAGSAVLEFYHDGGELVSFVDSITTSISNTDLTARTTGWTDCTFTAPAFSSKLQIGCYGITSTDACIIVYRPKGATSTNGINVLHLWGEAGNTVENSQNVIFPAVTNSSQQGQFAENTESTSAKVYVHTNGYYLPTGM